MRNFRVRTYRRRKVLRVSMLWPWSASASASPQRLARRMQQVSRHVQDERFFPTVPERASCLPDRRGHATEGLAHLRHSRLIGLCRGRCPGRHEMGGLQLLRPDHQRAIRDRCSVAIRLRSVSSSGSTSAATSCGSEFSPRCFCAGQSLRLNCPRGPGSGNADAPGSILHPRDVYSGIHSSEPSRL